MALTVSNNTELVLNGVGSAALIGTDGTLSPLGKLQDMTVSIKTTMEKVYGGDSIFEFFEFVKDKTCTFTFTSAIFNLNLLKLSQGSTAFAGETYQDEQVTVDGTSHSATLSMTTGVDATSLIVNDMTGKIYTQVASAPTTGQYSFAAGVLTFAAADFAASALVNVSYAATKATGLVGQDILATSVPGFVELRHVSNPVTMPDGHVYRLHTRVYKARCDGNLDVSQKRGAAEAPKLAFSSLDPQRSDKKFASFTMEIVS